MKSCFSSQQNVVGFQPRQVFNRLIPSGRCCDCALVLSNIYDFQFCGDVKDALLYITAEFQHLKGTYLDYFYSTN